MTIGETAPVPAKKPRKERATPNRRALQSERSRSDILDAAMRVIARHGFRDASIDLIAESAGISATSIYWHFGSRAGMLRALAMRITDRYKQAVGDTMGDPAPSDPEQWVRAYVAGVTRLGLEHPEHFHTQTALSTEGVMLPEISDGLKQYNREARRPTVLMIERGVAEGQFRPIKGTFWVDFVIGSLLGVSIQARFYVDGMDARPLYTAVHDASLLLLGLEPGAFDPGMREDAD